MAGGSIIRRSWFWFTRRIFGNFVSGLIILFERPVRIGDTVTTLVAFGYGQQDPYSCDNDYRFRSQRSDYPEQAFVTERLINWSLTDTTTRLVIRLGVAYAAPIWKKCVSVAEGGD